MPIIDHDGRFRAEIVAFGIDQKEGRNSVGFWCKYSLIEEWIDRDKAWTKLSGLDTAEGTVWIIKANGDKNDRGLDTLKHAMGWDGNAKSLNGETEWRPIACQVIVEREVYNNKPRMKVQWVNPWEGDGIPKAKVTPAFILNLQNSLDKKPGEDGTCDVF